MRKMIGSGLAAAAVAGGVALAGTANASPGYYGPDYTASNIDSICSELNYSPTLGMVDDIARRMYNANLTPEEAAYDFKYAVNYVCPQHRNLIQSWVNGHNGGGTNV